MRKNTFDIPQEEMDRFHKAMDAERTEQDARLKKLIESEKANIPSNEEIIKMIPSKAEANATSESENKSRGWLK